MMMDGKSVPAGHSPSDLQDAGENTAKSEIPMTTWPRIEKQWKEKKILMFNILANKLKVMTDISNKGREKLFWDWFDTPDK
jgi:hypothetical protein